MEERKRKRWKRLKSHGGVEQRSALEDEMASPPLYRNGEENQSSPSLCSRICAYITFDPHLCKPWPTSPPSTSALYQRVRHLLEPSHPRVVVRCVPATLRNFISYASLIIRRSFTRFPPPFLRVSIPLRISLSGKTDGRIRSLLSSFHRERNFNSSRGIVFRTVNNKFKSSGTIKMIFAFRNVYLAH